MKAKFNKLTVIITVIVLLVGAGLGTGLYFLLRDKDGEDDDLDDVFSYNTYFDTIKSSSDIYVIKSSALNNDETAMIVSLQGIVAQTNPCIFIDSDDTTKEYLKLFKDEKGCNLIYADTDNNEWTPWSLVQKFRDYIKDDGFTLFRRIDNNVGINMAAVLAGVENWLSVPDTLLENATSNGFTLKRDLTLEDSERIGLQDKIFKEYKSQLNTKLLIHQKENNVRLRDIGIQQKAFIFFTRETYSEKNFRKTVLNWADANAPIFGWTDDEVAFVDDISKTGKFIIAMDHAINCSYLAGAEFGLANQKYQKRIDINNIDDNKHYLAIVVSDGDNIQWVQGGFSMLSERLGYDSIDFHITWTYPPLLCELGSVVNYYTYNRATINDSFIAGVSGVGYMNPTRYPYQYMETFADMTVNSMKGSNLSVVTILDSIKSSNEADFIQKLGVYAKHDQIKGGILELGNRYEEGGGKVYFSNDKAFVSVRLSLWNHYGEDKNISKSWLAEQAAAVNSFDIDTSKIEGYTVINVHPWSMTIENLIYFVSLLNENIEIVSAEELIDVINLKVVR